MSDLRAIFQPRSVAVIGASRRPGTLGYAIVDNLLAFGFQGAIYPVNPHAEHVHSIRAWPSVEDIGKATGESVDLAMIVVPRDQVLEAVESCGRSGVRGLVVISAGFREVGGEARALEDRVTETVHRYGMRMVGPNCMGVINTDPAVRLDASFASSRPEVGRAAFASQSGALGEVILSRAREVGLGVSQFVSLGNKADVSGNDLLAWWAEDDATDVVLLYLESFGNPENFTRYARRLTRERRKPILAVKSGRTQAGAAAASSHTGSLAGGEVATRALFAHCGVQRCNTVEQLFDLASAFVHQPLPAGRRVAILTNAGGPAIMATDAAVHSGLTMAALGPETLELLRSVLPEEASLHNPVDMIASAGPEGFRACVPALLADPGVDALLVIFVAPAVVDSAEVARAIATGVEAGRAEGGADKPVLACFMGMHSVEHGGVALLREAGIPNYAFPETAAFSLARMARFREWLDAPVGDIPAFEVDRTAARGIVAAAVASGRSWISGTDALDLLACYGIPVVPSRQIETPEQAVAFAREVGFPVALKLDHPDLLHKSDVGGVQLDLRSEREIKGAFWDIAERLRAHPELEPPVPFLVQKMVEGGRETILGTARDPAVGHLLMFGLGGVFVEIMEDVVFQLHPITDADARRMIDGIKGRPLLDGYRGAPPADTATLEDVLLRISQLVTDLPEVAEMDLNPFLALPDGQGGCAVDVRVRLAP